MENPDTWGPAEKTIQAALTEHDRMMFESEHPVYGLSRARLIADALREAKLLRECTCTPGQKWHSMMCPTPYARMDEPAEDSSKATTQERGGADGNVQPGGRACR